MFKLKKFLGTHFGLWSAPISAIVTVLLAAWIQRLVGVFFYSIIIATVSIFISSLVILALVFAIRGQRMETWLRAATASLVGALLAFSFLATVPLNVDRSFSVWSLNQIYKQDKNRAGIPVSTLKQELEAYFSADSGEIDRRLTEQTDIGNISVSEEGKVTLTDQGIRQRNIFFGISAFFGLNPKYAR